jgi:hypothetical protein
VGDTTRNGVPDAEKMFFPLPLHLQSLEPIRQISCGPDYTLASGNAGIWAWGNGSGGKLGRYCWLISCLVYDVLCLVFGAFSVDKFEFRFLTSVCDICVCVCVCVRLCLLLLGVGDNMDRFEPVLIPALRAKPCLQVAAGFWHGMASKFSCF